MGKLLLVFACFVSSILGCFLSDTVLARFGKKTIVANEIILRDKDSGKMFFKVSSANENNSSGLIIFDAQERPKIGAFIDEKGSIISIFDESRNTKVSIGENAGGSQFTLYGENSTPVAAIRFDSKSKSGGMSIGNFENDSATVIAFYKGKPYIELFNKDKIIFTTNEK